MKKYLSNIALWLWPELKSMDAQRRLISTGNVLSVLYSFPLEVAGVIWLISSTNYSDLREASGFFLLIFLLMGVSQL